MLKNYSIRLQGFEMSVLIALTEQQVADLHAGKFVMCKRINTKTGETADFGFNASSLISLQESKTIEY